MNVEDVFRRSTEPGFKKRFSPTTTHECWVVKVSDDKAGQYGTCTEIFPDSFWTEIPPFFRVWQEETFADSSHRLTTVDK